MSLSEANGRVLASFKLPAAMYANQDDILNDSDIQDLLQLVAKSCGATAGAASHVHWHMPQTPMGNDVAGKECWLLKSGHAMASFV